MRKKDKEKIKTQVLNLDEVRAYSKQEKFNKRRKLPKKFVVLALLLILVGVLYLPGKTFVEKLQAEEKITPTDKNSITCIFNDKDKNGYEVSETIIYNFKSDNLIGYNKVSTTKLEKSEEMEAFKAFYDDLNKKYKDLSKEEGFDGTISLKENIITEKMTVDLEKLNKKSDLITYEVNTTKSKILKKEKENKRKCE